jgi:hypothetical protein
MYTYAEQLLRIVNKYIADGQPWPATARQIAAWAIDNKIWQAQPSHLINQCAEQLARAMRDEYTIDPQGRTVRAKHAARIEQDGEQLVLWADIRTASREHMQIAFPQRRHQIVGDCRQLKADVDSYNDNRAPDAPIQMTFDFTADIEELEALAV